MSQLSLGVVVVVAAAAALVVHVAGGGSAPAIAAGTASPTPRAIANAINLRLSDLPGFRFASGAGTSLGGNPGRQFKQCFGSSANAPGANALSVSSSDFVAGQGLQTVSLGSSVTFPTAAVLAHDVAVAKNPRFPQCFARALAALTVTGSGVQITGAGAQATSLPSALSHSNGVDPLLGMRVSMTWSVRGVSFPVYIDVSLATVGRDEIALFVFALDQPYSMADEEQLQALLASRALTQPH